MEEISVVKTVAKAMKLRRRMNLVVLYAADHRNLMYNHAISAMDGGEEQEAGVRAEITVFLNKLFNMKSSQWLR